MRDAVIFDLGGVLIDWNPRHLFRKLFDDEQAMEHFLATVCTPEWHLQHDAGKQFAETRDELKLRHPQHAGLIDAFGDRHDEMMAGAIDGTVALLERLAAADVPLFAITNFPAQMFPVAQERFPFLRLFGDVAVSGYERIVKPDPELFRILLRRNNIAASQAVFIDDVTRNVDAARALGLHGIRFTAPEALAQELQTLGILPARQSGIGVLSSR
jgi:2-haloacid dehalogenase